MALGKGDSLCGRVFVTVPSRMELWYLQYGEYLLESCRVCVFSCIYRVFATTPLADGCIWVEEMADDRELISLPSERSSNVRSADLLWLS